MDAHAPIATDIEAERERRWPEGSTSSPAAVQHGEIALDGRPPRSISQRCSEQSPLMVKGHVAASFSPTLTSREGESRRAYITRVATHEATKVLELFLPMLLGGVAEVLADNSLQMLIGHTAIGADTRVLAALTLTSMYPTTFVVCICLGVGSAVDTLCAQAFGGKRLAELWLFFQAGLLLCALLVPFLVAITLSAAPVLLALGQDAEIVDMSKGILVATSSSMPPLIVNTLVTSTLRAQSIAFPGFVASALAWVVSTPIVWWLAFYTPVGYVGIAMYVTVAYTVKSIVVIIAMVRSDAFATSWPGWQPRAAWRLMGKMKRLAGAGALLVVCSSMGFTVFSIVSGMLPEAATAVTASGIFLTVLSLAIVPLNAMASAGAVRVGNALGGGQSERAKLIAQLVLAACVFIGVFVMVTVSAVASPVARIFTTDAAAVELGTEMVRRLSPVFLVVALVCGEQGALSAMGEQFVSAIACAVSVIAVGVPFGLWCAISLDGGIVGLWSGSIVGFGVCALGLLIWLSRLDWEAAARRAEQRTHVDGAAGDHFRPAEAA